jgi:hypothetical protein
MTPKHFSTRSRFVTRYKYYPDQTAWVPLDLTKTLRIIPPGPSDHKALGRVPVSSCKPPHSHAELSHWRNVLFDRCPNASHTHMPLCVRGCLRPARLARAGCSTPAGCYCLRTGETLGTVGLPRREDRHGEEDPGVAGSQVAVGPAQETPLIFASRRPAPWLGADGGCPGSWIVTRIPRSGCDHASVAWGERRSRGERACRAPIPMPVTRRAVSRRGSTAARPSGMPPVHERWPVPMATR